MDILVSSNLERLLYKLSGDSDVITKDWMTKLRTVGRYEVTDEVKDSVSKAFYGGYCDDEATKATIAGMFEDEGYLCDTHTAVAVNVYDKYVKETGDKTPTVIVSTASPYKFTRSVMEALGKAEGGEDDFELADKLSAISKTTVPDAVAKIRNAPVLHDKVVKREEMQDAVLSFLNIQ